MLVSHLRITYRKTGSLKHDKLKYRSSFIT